jgi:hypothetical protein
VGKYRIRNNSAELGLTRSVDLIEGKEKSVILLADISFQKYILKNHKLKKNSKFAIKYDSYHFLTDFLCASFKFLLKTSDKL